MKKMTKNTHINTVMTRLENYDSPVIWTDRDIEAIETFCWNNPIEHCRDFEVFGNDDLFSFPAGRAPAHIFDENDD